MVNAKISLNEARERLAELVESVERQGTRFVFERDGQPAAVLLGHRDYEAIIGGLGWSWKLPSWPAAADGPQLLQGLERDLRSLLTVQDETYRQGFVQSLVTKLQDLWSLRTSGNSCFAEVLALLMATLGFCRQRELEKEQVRALLAVVSLLQKLQLDDLDVDRAFETLETVGLPTIPEPDDSTLEQLAEAPVE